MSANPKTLWEAAWKASSRVSKAWREVDAARKAGLPGNMEKVWKLQDVASRAWVRSYKADMLKANG